LTTPLPIDATSRKNPSEYPHNLLQPETRVHGEHFCRWQYGNIFIRFTQLSPKSR